MKAQKPLDPAYPRALITLGDHIRKRRIDLGLSQSQVAKIIGVAKASISDWETGTTTNEIRFIPKIHNFLGYCPYKPTQLLSQKIRLWRESLGLSQEQLAKQAGVDESALARWERGTCEPAPKSIRIIEVCFSSLFRYHVKL